MSAKGEGPEDPRQTVISPENLLRLQHPQPRGKELCPGLEVRPECTVQKVKLQV